MKNYAKGIALLTAAALFVKILSMLYRIPFQNLVGDEGFFIYQQVYPFVAIFMTWTSSGLAIAISKMIADEGLSSHSRKTAISQLLYRFLWILSFGIFIVFYSCAPFFASSMGDPQLEKSLKIAAFVIFTMPILSFYKGKLQATGDLSKVAFTQVIEQVVRVVIILGGTFYVMSTSKSLYLAGEIAILGTVIGEVAGVILLLVMIRKSSIRIGFFDRNMGLENKPSIMKKMLVVSVSASMSGLLLIFFQLIDSFTVFDSLLKFADTATDAMIEKGIYDRGQPLVQVGLVIASSMSMAVVPLISNALMKRQKEQALSFIRLTYQATLLFGTAATIGLMLIMPYINTLLFETADLSTVLAVYMLQIITLSVIVTITAILQGLGYRKWPTIILSSSILLKIIFNKLLIIKIGVVGAAIASNIALLFGAVGLIYYLKRMKKIQLANFHFYKITTLASLAMIIVVKIIIFLLGNVYNLPLGGRASAFIVVIISSLIGGLIFVLCITKFSLFTTRQWFLLPLGKKIASIQILLNKK